MHDLICFNGITLVALLRTDCQRWKAGQKLVISEEAAEIILVSDDGGLRLGCICAGTEKW